MARLGGVKERISMRTNIMRVATIVAIAVIVTTLLAVPSNVSAGGGPKIVQGWVWDNAGRNITGADVLIEIKDPNTWNTRASLTDTTDNDGYYQVSFGPSDWYDGDLINITVTYQASQVKNSTTALEGKPVQYLNATYPFEIPDFGSMAGFAIAGVCLGGIAMFLIVRRKKE